MVKQQYHTLNMYITLVVETETILESILEWDESFAEFADDLHTQIPLFRSPDLDTIEKELMRSAKEHHSVKRIVTL